MKSTPTIFQLFLYTLKLFSHNFVYSFLKAMSPAPWTRGCRAIQWNTGSLLEDNSEVKTFRPPAAINCKYLRSYEVCISQTSPEKEQKR